MLEIAIDAPPEAEIYVDEFVNGRRYLMALATSPMGDLVMSDEKRITLGEGEKGVMVGAKGSELELTADSIGGMPYREALAAREHELAAEAGRPIYYRPFDLSEEEFSVLVFEAANQALVVSGSEHRVDMGDVVAKPLRGHGYVALADERVVPAELAELVRSPLFQEHMNEYLGHYQLSDLKEASLARMREEMRTPDMAQAIAGMRGIVVQRAGSPEAEQDKPMGEVVYLKGRDNAETELVRAEGDGNKARQRRTALAADLELPPAARRALAAAKARAKAVDTMFADALETGLRIEMKGKPVSVADMATGKDDGLVGSVSERLRAIPQAQLDLIYVQTRETARQGLFRKPDEGSVLAMAMLDTEYRMRRRKPLADQSVKARFAAKFGKLMQSKPKHIDELHHQVVQEKMMRERIGEGDVSFLRIDPTNASAVKRTIEIWSRGMDVVKQANFANALSQRGVPDEIIQAQLKVVPRRDEAEEQAEVQAARLALGKGNGR